MFKCSFMNSYCLNRLLKEGYSYFDFVECYTDSTDGIYAFPIGLRSLLSCGDPASVMSCGDSASMMFLGYSRYDVI